MQVEINSNSQIKLLIENENKFLGNYHKKLIEQSSLKDFTDLLDKFIERSNYKKYLLKILEDNK